MTTVTRRSTGRRALVARTVVILLVTTLITACSSGGDGGNSSVDHRGPEATAPSDETADSGGASESPRSLPAGPVDPDLVDVPDGVFPGRGDPRIDVLRYDIELRVDPDEPTLQGRARIELRVLTADPLESFTLDLRGPEVQSVTVDDDPAAVTVDDLGDQITIEPSMPITPDSTPGVEITWTGEPGAEEFPAFGVPIGWQSDGEGGWFTLGQPDGTSTWVPVNDHPSDKATWRVTIDTPAALTGVSNGDLISSEQDGDRRRWVWEVAEPMAPHLLLAAVGDYRLIERTGPDDLPVTIAVHSTIADSQVGGFEKIDEIIDFFTDTFGEYPMSSAGAIVVPADLNLALETQTRPTFGTDGIAPGLVWALAHEIAHEWFGNAVTPARWDDLWLSESFATYADWLWLDHNGDENIDDLAAGAERATGRRAVLDPEAAANFSNMIYGGGARALHGLRLQIGDDDFFEILRTWYADNQGDTASTDDFIALAEEISGEDLSGWVEAWLESPEQPDLPD